MIFRIYDINTGNILDTLLGHTWTINSTEYNCDGTKIVSGSGDFSICLWDAYSNSLIKKFEWHVGPVSSACFVPEGSEFVSGGGQDGTIRFWDNQSGKSNKIIQSESPLGGVYMIQFNNDGSRMACEHNNDVYVYDTKLNSYIRYFSSCCINTMAFSNDGSRIAFGGGNYLDRYFNIKLYDANTGTLVKEIVNDTSVYSLDFDRNSSKLAGIGAWGPIKLWNAEYGNLIRTIDGYGWRIKFNPNGTNIACGSYDIRIYGTTMGNLIKTLSGHSNSICSIAYSNDGTKLISCGLDSTIKLWDVKSGNLIHTFKGHNNVVVHAALNNDASLIVSASPDGTVKLWRVPGATAILDNKINYNSSKISSISPNPTSSNSTISYYLDKHSSVSLSLQSILGENIIQLEKNIYKEAGSYSVELNTSELPSGVYFCTLKAGCSISTEKIVVVK